MYALVCTCIHIYGYTHMYITFIYIYVCILFIIPPSEYTMRTNCPTESHYWDKIYLECHSHHFIQVLLSFLPLGNFWRNYTCKPTIPRNCWSEINGHNETTPQMNSDFLYSFLKRKQEDCISVSALQFLHKLKILFSFPSSRSETSTCLVSKSVF